MSQPTIHSVSILAGRAQVLRAFLVLMVLIFSKSFYVTSISSYYTFYLMHKFNLSVQSAQIHLFVFLFAMAAGTLLGGPIGDRIGRKLVIWVSILGVAPFALMLPHANLMWTGVLTFVIGLVLASAFSAILVLRRNSCPARSAPSPVCFSGLPSAWVASALPCWAVWRIRMALSMCTRSVPTCRCWA